MYLFSLKWYKPSLDNNNSTLYFGQVCTILWYLEHKKCHAFLYFEKESNLSSYLLSLARSPKSISSEGREEGKKRSPFSFRSDIHARSWFLTYKWEGAWASRFTISLALIFLHLLSAADWCSSLVHWYPVPGRLHRHPSLSVHHRPQECSQSPQTVHWIASLLVSMLTFLHQNIWLKSFWNWKSHHLLPKYKSQNKLGYDAVTNRSWTLGA